MEIYISYDVLLSANYFVEVMHMSNEMLQTIRLDGSITFTRFIHDCLEGRELVASDKKSQFQIFFRSFFSLIEICIQYDVPLCAICSIEMIHIRQDTAFHKIRWIKYF